jgi:tRNA 2-thiouridine synthesizing protein B
MLLILTSSPFVKPLPQTSEVTMVLTQDAVIAATLTSTTKYQSVYALKDDLVARGLGDQLVAGIEVIDYQQFVQLTLSHQPIVSW